MTNEEFEQYLSTVNKKLDKILSMQTKIAKSLHLIPVTEKEEKSIQILQRHNLQTAAKVNNELNAMENKSDDSQVMSITDLFNAPQEDIYSDIIGNDYLGGN